MGGSALAWDTVPNPPRAAFPWVAKGASDALYCDGDGWDPRTSKEETLRVLADRINVDKLRDVWQQHCGPDDRMDHAEYKAFVQSVNLPAKHASRLWRIIDGDCNGVIEEHELKQLLSAMTHRQAWQRFCPTCMHERSCKFCRKVSDCPDCTSVSFCVKHWARHPGLPPPAPAPREQKLRQGRLSLEGPTPDGGWQCLLYLPKEQRLHFEESDSLGRGRQKLFCREVSRSRWNGLVRSSNMPVWQVGVSELLFEAREQRCVDEHS